MKKILLTLIVITVAAYSHAITNISGNFSVGAGQTYTTLTNDSATGFFKFLNSIDGIDSVISGPITVSIVSDITYETGVVSLNALHYNGGGPYTVTIVPGIDQTILTISGFQSSPKGLIDFSGAANVTINGNSNGTGNYLTFNNTAGGGSYATFTFENDANNITIKYCTIEGSPLNSSQQFGPGYSGADPAYIFIGNGITTGNYNITFDHNNIGSDNYVDQCFIANSTTVNNHDITISNNNIFNFQDPGYTIYDYGIYITQSGTGAGSHWNISGNSFYETGIGTENPTGTYSEEFIYFYPGASSTGDTISGNYLGGNLPQCAPGASPEPGYFLNNAYTGNSSASVSNFIDVSCGTIAITNNVIRNIDFIGGYASLVLLNITGATTATVSGNEFGDNTASLGIETENLNVAVYIKGINNASTGTVMVNNNQFLNLYALGGNGQYGFVEPITFTGASANSQITNNTINSCQAFGSYDITDNDYAININPASGTMSNLLISGNTIQIPYATTEYGYYEMGIFVQSGVSFSGTISANRIYDHEASMYSAVYGIYMDMTGSGTYNYAVVNNQVSLTNPGGNSDVSMYGIADGSCNGAGSTANYFYNSVYIGGSSTSTIGSYSFYNDPCFASGAGPALNIKNNIFINARTGGSGIHYSIYNGYTGGGWASGASDYNLLVSRGTLGYWYGSGAQTFSQWQTSSSGDAHSLSAAWTSSTSSFAGSPYPGSNTLNPSGLFTATATGDLSINTSDGNSYKFIHNLGTDLTSYGDTTDYYGTPRCPNSGCPGGASHPDIGSDEFSNLSTAVNELVSESSLMLYPNPASDQLTIYSSSLHSDNAITVSVFNMLGETIQSEKMNWNNGAVINIKTLSTGIYLLQLKSESGSFVKRFVKE